MKKKCFAFSQKNAAKRSRQHAGKNTGNKPRAVCALSMNKSLDPTKI